METASVEALRALATYLVADGSVGQALERIAEIAVTSTPADVAGLTLLAGDRPTTAVFTDPVSPKVDAEQYETGSGPCIDAARYLDVYRIDDTATEDRWPSFARACADNGIASVIAFPLRAHDERLGALNLYAYARSAFADLHDDGLAFAETAAVVLANAQAYHEAKRLSENLAEALKSRSIIDQAKGMLMARSNMDADEAFDLLRKASQRENIKLRDIAQRIVNRERLGE